MAAQRQREIYPSGGASFLSALSGGVTEQLQQRQKMAQERQLAQAKAEDEMKMMFAKALAESKLKRDFPELQDAEEQANQEILGMARQAGEVPEPMGGYNTAERMADVPNRVGQAAQQRKLEFLKYLLPGRGTTSQPVNVYQYEGGRVSPAEGGLNLPPRSRVIVPPPSPESFGEREQARIDVRSGSLPALEEQKQRLSAAGARGTQQVKYEDLVKQFSFISKDVDSVLGFLDKIPSGRVAGPGAQLGAVFGMKGSENVLQYTRTKDLILSKIAKTFGGEVGVLTEGDIQRISKGFPALWMNEQERATSVQWVKDYIQRRIAEYSKTNALSSGGTSFATEAEAEAANLPLGTRITIGGRPVEVQ